MTATPPIKTLFANDIHRRIEEVIKVDQNDEEILRDEINEYVVTGAIRSHYTGIYEAYRETPNKPHEGIAIWVSGFFGSGKSSFAKMLGLSIANRTIGGESAAERFGQRTGDKKLQVLLKAIAEQIPTHAVIFDVSTDRGIKSGNQTLTEIMYRLFLQSLGYSKDLDLSSSRSASREKGQAHALRRSTRPPLQEGLGPPRRQGRFALSGASRVLHSLEPDTYPWPLVGEASRQGPTSPAASSPRRGASLMKRRKARALADVRGRRGRPVRRCDVQKDAPICRPSCRASA
jgi:hypothetical protein